MNAEIRSCCCNLFALTQLGYIRKHYAGKGHASLQERDSVVINPTLFHCRLSCCSLLPVAAPGNVSPWMLPTATIDSYLVQVKLERDSANTVLQQSRVNTFVTLFWRIWAQSGRKGNLWVKQK